MIAPTAIRPRVLVMMATYNGECYLAEQIDSILAQEDVAVSLLISDDGSSDKTCAICEGYAQRFANVKFRVNPHNKGLSKNFMDMLYESDVDLYDYLAFSDQDDFWESCKLARAIEKLRSSGSGPRLYYSDVCNVNERLNGDGREFEPFAGRADSLALLLTVNWASGCTMVLNREFARILKEYEPPSWPRNHDGWIHLVALACGWAVSDLENSYIKRRLSGENQVGERGLGRIDLARIRMMFHWLVSDGGNPHWGTRTAKYALEGYSRYMPKENISLLKQYARAPKSLLMRLKLCVDPRFKSPYRQENILYSVKMILNKY